MHKLSSTVKLVEAATEAIQLKSTNMHSITVSPTALVNNTLLSIYKDASALTSTYAETVFLQHLRLTRMVLKTARRSPTENTTSLSITISLVQIK
jgi:hypothetical protein